MTDRPKGGAFLLEETNYQDVFIPEEFTEEEKSLAQTAADFIESEVMPKNEEIENKKEGLMPSLLKKAGELGLLMIDVPEKYEGLGITKTASMLILEKIAKCGSFATSYGAHTGIGTFPIMYFGTTEQKKKYLGDIISGAKLAAYALTEAGAGTDALNAKTKAVLSPDGKHYILNGEKLFITNGGFANVFIVFAKIDGEKFTAFIVDRDTQGLSIGPEEKKLGIRGSSTTPVILQDAKVPVENVLGEIGKGHIIAFNVLNIGRFKLGAGALGAGKVVLEEAVKYANVRKQFNQPIASFGMIKDKIASMAIKMYIGEAMSYRVAGLIENVLKSLDQKSADYEKNVIDAIKEYATECSIMKVYGSEVLDFVVDEALQMLGGYGYCQEYPIERYYRDSRINKIYEGTNEINRLLIPGTLLRRAMKNEIPLLVAAKKLIDEILSFEMPEMGEGVFAEEIKLIRNMKKVFLMAAGSAAQIFMDKIIEEQNVLACLADIVIEIFAMESGVLRAMKVIEKRGEDKSKYYISATKCYINETIPQIDFLAKKALAGTLDGDMLQTTITALRRYTKYAPINTIALREEIADKVREEEKYIF